MNKNSVLVAIIGTLGGFICGFIVANTINRSEITNLRNLAAAPSANLQTTKSGEPNDTLSPQEIKAKIDEADQNPTNFNYQKNLGIALYRYSAMKNDRTLLETALRILERAASLDQKDYDVLVALGNAHFDIGFVRKDAASFQKARELYLSALTQKPEDTDVRTDMGLTYFMQEPPDLEKAAAELQKVQAADPKHERSLQFLVQVLLKQNKRAEADKAFSKLKTLNPSNPASAEINQVMSAGNSNSAK